MNLLWSSFCVLLITVLHINALKLLPAERTVIKQNGTTRTISRYLLVPQEDKELSSDTGLKKFLQEFDIGTDNGDGNSVDRYRIYIKRRLKNRGRGKSEAVGEDVSVSERNSAVVNEDIQKVAFENVQAVEADNVQSVDAVVNESEDVREEVNNNEYAQLRSGPGQSVSRGSSLAEVSQEAVVQQNGISQERVVVPSEEVQNEVSLQSAVQSNVNDDVIISPVLEDQPIVNNNAATVEVNSDVASESLNIQQQSNNIASESVAAQANKPGDDEETFQELLSAIHESPVEFLKDHIAGLKDSDGKIISALLERDGPNGWEESSDQLDDNNIKPVPISGDVQEDSVKLVDLLKGNVRSEYTENVPDNSLVFDNAKSGDDVSDINQASNVELLRQFDKNVTDTVFDESNYDNAKPGDDVSSRDSQGSDAEVSRDVVVEEDVAEPNTANVVDNSFVFNVPNDDNVKVGDDVSYRDSQVSNAEVPSDFVVEGDKSAQPFSEIIPDNSFVFDVPNNDNAKAGDDVAFRNDQGPVDDSRHLDVVGEDAVTSEPEVNNVENYSKLGNNPDLSRDWNINVLQIPDAGPVAPKSIINNILALLCPKCYQRILQISAHKGRPLTNPSLQQIFSVLLQWQNEFNVNQQKVNQQISPDVNQNILQFIKQIMNQQSGQTQPADQSLIKILEIVLQGDGTIQQPSPNVQLFTIENLRKVLHALELNVQTSPNVETANLYKIIKLIFETAKTYEVNTPIGSNTPWYNQGPADNPVVKYVFNLLHQSWLQEIMTQIVKNNYNLKVVNNPKWSNILIAWQIPAQLLEPNAVFEDNDLNLNVHGHVDANGMKPDDAKIVLTLLKKYIQYIQAHYSQKGSADFNQNQKQILYRISVYLQQRGYQLQFIQALIRKLFEILSSYSYINQSSCSNSGR
ncbi:uncharacterized protein LOC142984240 isoform X2 [Anticarsia gemmatalis]|uniref:uncharacterized protein LOC142984240 isoform X2 n=1 Tax=Anticarsia gemmatalis TaxID=129554 RepID=UPI003F76418C